jgi:putative ABC transport system permease protein|nr:hypothetical protein [Actinomyces sp.]
MSGRWPDSPNAVVSRADLVGDAGIAGEGLEVLDSSAFINTLPGYSAQVLTFSLMIGSLIVIASFVLGIFIYVLTLQKRPVLGMLKARGVPTGYLIVSGAAQTALLSAVGVAIGLFLTSVSALALPPAVPFRVDALMDAAIADQFALHDHAARAAARTAARDDLLDELGIRSLAGKYPSDLSGGERQRAATGAGRRPSW